jgi:hypothetical protein
MCVCVCVFVCLCVCARACVCVCVCVCAQWILAKSPPKRGKSSEPRHEWESCQALVQAAISRNFKVRTRELSEYIDI